ncbi:hypothetical protein L915_03714, partial [Phytophthora nicotianae]
SSAPSLKIPASPPNVHDETYPSKNSSDERSTTTHSNPKTQSSSNYAILSCLQQPSDSDGE